MFLIDDFLLACVIAIILLLVTTFTSGILCFLGFLIGCGSKSEMYGGSKKPTVKRDLKAIKKLKDNIDISLKSFTNEKQTYNTIERLIETYGYVEPPAEYMKMQTNRINEAKNKPAESHYPEGY